MATTSMSLRPASTAARRTLRPMRPNPLMATRTDISRSPSIAQGRGGTPYVVSAISNRAQCRFRHLLGGNAEMLVKLLVRRAGAEPVMPTKAPFEPMMASQPWRMPASTATLTAALPMIAARSASGAASSSSKHGTETTRAEILLRREEFLRRDRDGDFRAGGEQRHLRPCRLRRRSVHRRRAAQRFAASRPEPQLRQVLARQRQHARAVLATPARSASTRRSRPRRTAGTP